MTEVPPSHRKKQKTPRTSIQKRRDPKNIPLMMNSDLPQQILIPVHTSKPNKYIKNDGVMKLQHSKGRNMKIALRGGTATTPANLAGGLHQALKQQVDQLPGIQHTAQSSSRQASHTRRTMAPDQVSDNTSLTPSKLDLHIRDGRIIDAFGNKVRNTSHQPQTSRRQFDNTTTTTTSNAINEIDGKLNFIKGMVTRGNRRRVMKQVDLTQIDYDTRSFFKRHSEKNAYPQEDRSDGGDRPFNVYDYFS